MNGWLTPAVLPSTTRQCVLTFPDSEEFQSLVLGALSLLASVENYEEFGAVSAIDTSDAMRQTLFDFLEGDCILFPVGGCLDWPSDTIPDGFLDTNQGAVSRTTYAALFAVIGTTWGSGNGSTTFDLPHKDGRVTVGKKSGDTDFDTLGENGGAKTVTLTEAQLPVVTVLQNSHNHTQNSHNHAQDAHTHTVWANLLAVAGTNRRAPAALTSTDNTTTAPTTATNQAATATNQAATATNQSFGSGNAHDNLMPYVVMNYIIRYK